jgi:hypothetical protein
MLAAMRCIASDTHARPPRHTHESVHAQRGELRHARVGGRVGADSEGGVRVRGRRASCGVMLSISVKLGGNPAFKAQTIAAYADQLMASGRGPLPLVTPR